MDWISGVIPMALIEFALVVVIFRYYERCTCDTSSCCQCPFVQGGGLDGSIEDNVVDRSNLEEDTGDAVSVSSVPHPTARSIQFQIRFENTYQSTLSCNYLLLTTRILSFLYICGITIVILYIGEHDGLFYFTTWNTVIISIYFLCAVVCSIIGMAYGTIDINRTSGGINNGAPLTQRVDVVWSSGINKWTRFVHVLFEVSGGTAAFVTVVAFSLLDRSFTFINASLHFVTIVTMIVELYLNNLYVRFDHFPLNLGWAVLYLIFVWPIVETGLKTWPYEILNTSTYLSFVLYTALLVANFIFYSVFYLLSELKFQLITSHPLQQWCSTTCSACSPCVYHPTNGRQERTDSATEIPLHPRHSQASQPSPIGRQGHSQRELSEAEGVVV